MKPEYRNWMPKGMIMTAGGVTVFFLLLTILFAFCGIVSGTARTVLTAVCTVVLLIGIAVTVWMILMYRTFSYNGKKQLSKKIIDKVASFVDVPEGGKCLDVGCGSGALTIACAKRNPKASFIGIDRWGKEYASFSRTLCEKNAQAEGVSNIRFMKGDATSLHFEDEAFDAVTSNYVYHNIPSKDRQAILLETLRTLKKGGTFVIHDIFSRSKYGDMQAFMEHLKEMGYEDVRLIDTADGDPITKWQAVWMELKGSAILTGRK